MNKTPNTQTERLSLTSDYVQVDHDYCSGTCMLVMTYKTVNWPCRLGKLWQSDDFESLLITAGMVTLKGL